MLVHAVWVLVKVLIGMLLKVLLEVLAKARAHFDEIDCKVLGGTQVTVRARFCKIDGARGHADWGVVAGAVLGFFAV